MIFFIQQKGSSGDSSLIFSKQCQGHNKSPGFPTGFDVKLRTKSIAAKWFHMWSLKKNIIRVSLLRKMQRL